MVHRFYHMWQQSDCSVKTVTRANPSGCFGDLYPYVGIARGDDTGANSMGFFNMHEGDAPVLKKLADKYALSDNFARAPGSAVVDVTGPDLPPTSVTFAVE
jgi:phospholipase C